VAKSSKATEPPSPPSAPARAVPMPAWFPAWAREFAELYFAGTTSVFLLHGDVHDLVPLGPGPDGEYGSLPQFLATQLFGSWEVVLRHDLSQGLRVYTDSAG
jgi:hypothetical protein